MCAQYVRGMQIRKINNISVISNPFIFFLVRILLQCLQVNIMIPRLSLNTTTVKPRLSRLVGTRMNLGLGYGKYG